MYDKRETIRKWTKRQKIVRVTKKGSAKRRPTLERPEASPNRSYIAYVRHQNRKMLGLKRLLTLRNAADEKKRLCKSNRKREINYARSLHD